MNTRTHGSRRFAVLFSLALILLPQIGRAQGDVEIDISSASVVTIRKSLADRFGALREYFQNGAIGLTRDGLIAMRDPGALKTETRREVESLITDDNKDRLTLYREIARLNGRPDWEAGLRSTFADRWISRAPRGWYYRESDGLWARKP
jgi:uncharacterized protein YdbL (DUF1318 family)